MNGAERRNAGTKLWVKPDTALRDRRINIRITEQEDRQIRNKARNWGITVSQLLVRAALNANGFNFSGKKEFMSKLHQLRYKVYRADVETSLEILREEVLELCRLLSSLMEDAGS